MATVTKYTAPVYIVLSYKMQGRCFYVQERLQKNSQRFFIRCFRRGVIGGILLSHHSYYCHSCNCPYNFGAYALQEYIEKGELMKVVVLKSPKGISGILRLIFGIKKND